MYDPLEGIAEADALLGRPFPLPSAPLPLVRWVEVVRVGEHAVEVVWNLDDSRPDTPARFALYAGGEPPPERVLAAARKRDSDDGRRWIVAPLAEAQASLRPVHEVSWSAAGLHLRVTAQGPWDPVSLEKLVASVVV